MSQPSASQRLATLERRLGVTLFERDTTGARATHAGAAFATEAVHVLDHLAALPARALAAASAPIMRIGTIPSLGALVFPALDDVLRRLGGAIHVDQRIDHGDRLIEWVGEGSLDAVVVGIAAQFALPHNTAAIELGKDRMAAFVPAGATAPTRGRRPLDGFVPFHSLDLTSPFIASRISALGGRPRLTATGEVAVIAARRTSSVALLSRAIARAYAGDGERVVASPVPVEFTLSLVTRAPVADEIARLVPLLAQAMRLAPAS